DKDANGAILACGGDIERLKKSLEDFFNTQLRKLPDGLDQEPQQTLSFHRVLQRAVIHPQSAEKKEINGGHPLIRLVRQPHLYAVYLLEQQGITRFDVVNYVSHGISKIGTTEEPAQAEREEEEQSEDGRSPRRVKPLEAFAINLVAKAQHGSIDPLIGRDD